MSSCTTLSSSDSPSTGHYCLLSKKWWFVVVKIIIVVDSVQNPIYQMADAIDSKTTISGPPNPDRKGCV